MLLTELPTELIGYIVNELSRDDLKSLRLTHQIFENSTSRRLFTTVVISKTKRDLTSLLGIANSPRLATIPTRLVWYELTEDQNHHLQENDEYELARFQKNNNFSQYMHRTYSMLYNLAASAFWTEPFFTNDDLAKYKDMNDVLVPRSVASYPKRRLATQASTEEAIGAAVRKLVNLHTIVAQPMPVDRVLAVSDEGYQLVAGMMQNLTHLTSARDPNGLFLLSRACVGEALTRQIRSLYLAGPFARPDVFKNHYAASDDTLALFESLTTLDLCMHWVRTQMGGVIVDPDQETAESVARCLRLATKLQHLTICFETLSSNHVREEIMREILSTRNRPKAEAISEPDVEDPAEVESSDDHDQATWPRLESFEITDAVLVEQSFSRFLKSHSATLKHLSIFNCSGVGKALVSSMAAMPRLKLFSFRVQSERSNETAHRGARDDYLVPEQTLLAFVNKEIPDNPLAGTARKVFSTGPFVWEPQDWPSAAYNDLVSCIVPQGRGHPTTNWTFYQEYKDGTTVHGFGAEPLEFFEDWDSEDGQDESPSGFGSEQETLPGPGWRGRREDEGKPTPIRMYAVPSVWSRAFRRFLKDPFDLGDPLEVGVDIIKLGATEVLAKAPDSDPPSTTSSVVTNDEPEPLGSVIPDCLLTLERGYIMKDMLLWGVTASPLNSEVGVLKMKVES
ncbi:hypothetical protein SEUCBS140593_007497 [Sporothrix eucalyptigena]|uniref:F-box domain-containing protein n=1 Tax=Sporothrix eucalyptigena TaxID=1812306 RepID=A0ABP0CDS3_9PEZI